MKKRHKFDLLCTDEIFKANNFNLTNYHKIAALLEKSNFLVSLLFIFFGMKSWSSFHFRQHWRMQLYFENEMTLAN